MDRAPFDVVVVGNVGIDTNVYLYGDEIDFDVEANFTENLDYVGQAGGYTLADSIQRGQIVARYTCTLKATSSNLMTWEELDRVFQKFAQV